MLEILGLNQGVKYSALNRNVVKKTYQLISVKC